MRSNFLFLRTLNFAEFSTMCKLFEGSRKSCLRESACHHIPNVTAFFSTSTADISDLRALIKEIVRDELRVVLPDYFNLDTALPEPSMRGIIREELRSALRRLHQLPEVPVQCARPASYAATPITRSAQVAANIIESFAENRLQTEAAPNVAPSFTESRRQSGRRFAP